MEAEAIGVEVEGADEIAAFTFLIQTRVCQPFYPCVTLKINYMRQGAPALKQIISWFSW